MNESHEAHAACWVTIEVNGVEHKKSVQPRVHLVDFLRENLDMRTVRAGCEHGVCGSCTVRLDGDIVRGCLVLAVQADGGTVETIDAASDRGDLLELQHAFHAHNALQCGFCTSGMLFTAAALIEEKPDATRADVREYMSGNYCRCTGYHAIIDAICSVLEARRQRRAEGSCGHAAPVVAGSDEILPHEETIDGSA
ncbi:aerobic-type carbon monoxide dehydrogenase, small subunit CoxS/CutS-like protein [Burkholderia sp. Ch1-1]|uniref:Aerobic-type carbon monoxide dehydrogenase, small subunit CoxS/CutS-like protein n=1 Tax=Paraburkholderia dioscoreae TaxID=2604047 RepID=A0A5Q4Z9Y1_9BURK|nr:MULTISPECIES: (2Fe-2S)-binding protein [Paraburkholderia]EIF28843.1 aerobic-type carbon monoxide dehydrogenase, small subunit CoxS/CutS-like protein [Burkholderia sp. Ch1-1]MDR8400698.1 (2Fe-2S)-binding protein [Paraburkholderia sp. USG1]VVD26692.1 Aerobic-type carbon monoxide dehydrogenase, small subunit CoxS/CutS-like protein [Paraburkholderia dioscoreae]